MPMEKDLYTGWVFNDAPPTDNHVLVDRIMLKRGILQNAQDAEGAVGLFAIARVIPKDAAPLAMQETVEFTDLPPQDPQ